MTFLVDIAGCQAFGLNCYGGEEELWARINGLPPPECHFKGKTFNIAPRPKHWQPSTNNTQRPPLTGPEAGKEPEVIQPRAPDFGPPIEKTMKYDLALKP